MKIGIVHYITSERDGVSLEIEKRIKVLQRMGHEVFYVTGQDKGAKCKVYLVPELSLRDKEVTTLRKTCFEKKVLSENKARALYLKLEEKLKRKIKRIIDTANPEILFVHNLFSHAYNLPATTALLQTLDKTPLKTVAVDHDFWFEREKFLRPNYEFVKKILNTLPPKRKYLKHEVINSIAQERLRKKRGIKAEVIGDYFDYDSAIFFDTRRVFALKRRLKIREKDLVVLQATRITPRKAIENCFLFSKQLEDYLHKKAPISLFGHRLFEKDSKVIVVLPNFVEVDARDYLEKLRELAKALNLRVIFAENLFSGQPISKGKYSFWEAYSIADLVTYTSVWEGFGNQFLEGIYFKKLLVLFEYPVFEKDLKKEGYRYVSLGNKTRKRRGFCFVPKAAISRAVKEAVRILQDPPELQKITERNFKIAKKYHSFRELEKLLLKDLSL